MKYVEMRTPGDTFLFQNSEGVFTNTWALGVWFVVVCCVALLCFKCEQKSCNRNENTDLVRSSF